MNVMKKHINRNIAYSGWYAMRIEKLSIVLFVLTMILSLHGCEKKPAGEDNGGEYKVTFYWTPAGSTQQGPLVETYKFNCFDDITLPNCAIFYFKDVPPHNSNVDLGIQGDWLGFPQSQTNCSDFIAEVTEQSGSHFSFIGQLDQTTALGVLRVSGYYDKTIIGGGSESGTFTASCDLIRGGTGNTQRCP